MAVKWVPFSTEYSMFGSLNGPKPGPKDESLLKHGKDAKEIHEKESAYGRWHYPNGYRNPRVLDAHEIVWRRNDPFNAQLFVVPSEYGWESDMTGYVTVGKMESYVLHAPYVLSILFNKMGQLNPTPAQFITKNGKEDGLFLEGTWVVKKKSTAYFLELADD